MKKLFVGNLALRTNDDDLFSFFQEYGPVGSARVITDRETGRSRGFGFVEIDDDDTAEEAIRSLNGAVLDGNQVVVNEARPLEKRAPSGGGGSFRSGGGGGYSRDSRDSRGGNRSFGNGGGNRRRY